MVEIYTQRVAVKNLFPVDVGLVALKWMLGKGWSQVGFEIYTGDRLFGFNRNHNLSDNYKPLALLEETDPRSLKIYKLTFSKGRQVEDFVDVSGCRREWEPDTTFAVVETLNEKSTAQAVIKAVKEADRRSRRPYIS